MSLLFQSQLQQLQPEVPTVVWAAERTVRFVPWHPSSLSSRAALAARWEEAPSTAPRPSAPPPRAPLCSHKAQASRDPGRPRWASASRPLPRSAPLWEPRWEVLAPQVRINCPHLQSLPHVLLHFERFSTFCPKRHRILSFSAKKTNTK